MAACGEDETSTSGTAGNGTDRAFVAEVIPHHRSAVEMAETAERRTKRAGIKDLAATIVSTQNAEIDQLQRFDRDLQAAGVEPGDLGMAAHEMGTDMDPSMLENARPFDREFIAGVDALLYGSVGDADREKPQSR